MDKNAEVGGIVYSEREIVRDFGNTTEDAGENEQKSSAKIELTKTKTSGNKNGNASNSFSVSRE